MTKTELIALLQESLEAHGDGEVYALTSTTGAITAALFLDLRKDPEYARDEDLDANGVVIHQED